MRAETVKGNYLGVILFLGRLAKEIPGDYSRNSTHYSGMGARYYCTILVALVTIKKRNNPRHFSCITLVYSTLVIINMSYLEKLNCLCSGDEEVIKSSTSGQDEQLSKEAADSLLDEEDSMETGLEDPTTRSEVMRASHPEVGPSSLGKVYGAQSYQGGKRGRDLSASTMDCPSGTEMPSLPPIYHSVHRKKVSKMIVRHLDGNAYQETDSTTIGASISPLVQVGSFANAGDKRHNRTTHRYDHVKSRNISTSFDPNKFICTTCNNEHPVLRRSIEGNDVGLDNPPVFVLSDQNFPSMVPVGGEGECLKIMLIENGLLTELVEAFLGMTRGFDVPAGSVILLGSASCAAASGTAEYAAEFVRAAGVLRGAFAGGVNVMHGIPFLIGGTKNTTAVRALAEIQQWVHCTSVGTDDISATRKAFAATLRTDTTSSAHSHIIKLPSSLSGGERVPFVVSGFDNLKMAIDPISEEDEKALLVLLLEELNTLYPVNLDTDIVCDRFMEDDVFDEKTMDRTDLVLIGASHWPTLQSILETKNGRSLTLPSPVGALIRTLWRR
jgi:hypothetical protein